MTCYEVMSYLESVGTAQNRTIYKRHGARDPLFGVSFKELRTLAKRLGRDQALALSLWETENVDARILATMIADGSAFNRDMLHDWVDAIDYYILLDEFVSNVAFFSPARTEVLEDWLSSVKEYTLRAAYTLVAILTRKLANEDDTFFERVLPMITCAIADAPNRAKEGMNTALLAIGMRSNALREQALAVADHVGPITINHGDTSCVTHDARKYLRDPKKVKRIKR